MRALLQDLRYGIRTLTRTPGFTVIAIAVLALGIGANALVFSLANTVFLQPLPAADPGTVVRVYSNRFSNTSHATYVALRDRNSTLAGLASFEMRSVGLRIDRDVEPAFGELVAGNYFPLLGLNPTRGRLLADTDDRAGAPPVVVLSEAFWKNRLAQADDVVGRTIVLNGIAFTVVGVAPERFAGLMRPLTAALWVPAAADALLRPMLGEAERQNRSSPLIGRLKPGVDLAHAQAELDTIGRQLRQDAGEPAREQAAVTVYPATALHPEFNRPLSVMLGGLMAVMALVLGIVCVNVANLVLARAAGRGTELAIRQSLGAARRRLIRQLLTENGILAAAGVLGGLAIAFWGTRALTAIHLPTPFPIAIDVSLDWRVFLFTALVGAGATLGFGAVPAFAATRVDLAEAVKGQRSGRARDSRLRSAFLVAQVAMSVLLLVVAGLFIRSAENATSIDPGFDRTNVVVGSIDLETRGYSPARGQEFLHTLHDRLNGAGGLAAATLVDIVPVTLSNQTIDLLYESDPEPARGERSPRPRAYTNNVGPGHFRTLRIGLLAGRDFTHTDTATAPRVAIVNETFARQFWPGESAVGRRLRPQGETDRARIIEVVGVVRDSKYVTVGEEDRPFVYLPLAQSYTPRVTVIARSNTTTAEAVALIRSELRALDEGLALFAVSTLSDATSLSLLPAQMGGMMLATLGGLALILAALGIYGVLSFLVRQRTREIGVRVAIGASPRAVVRLIVGQACRWTLIGGAAGILLSLGVTRLLAGVLYGVSPTDPATYGAVALLLSTVAALAAWLPAHRATRVDPLIALREG
jgi:predicted permease